MLKYSYAVLGIGFIVIIGALWYLSSEREVVETSMMTLTSTAFENGGAIPQKYTCDGDRLLSPPLTIANVPEGATMLVLVMDDPDVPKELRPDGVFDHWVMYGIDPMTTEIPEGSTAGAQGENGAGNTAYTGPCPPKEYEPSEHRYFFRLYATDLPNLNFIKAPTKADVLGAIEGHVIETAELMGRYQRI